MCAAIRDKKYNVHIARSGTRVTAIVCSEGLRTVELELCVFNNAVIPFSENFIARTGVCVCVCVFSVRLPIGSGKEDFWLSGARRRANLCCACGESRAGCVMQIQS